MPSWEWIISTILFQPSPVNHLNVKIWCLSDISRSERFLRISLKIYWQFSTMQCKKANLHKADWPVSARNTLLVDIHKIIIITYFIFLHKLIPSVPCPIHLPLFLPLIPRDLMWSLPQSLVHKYHHRKSPNQTLHPNIYNHQPPESLSISKIDILQVHVPNKTMYCRKLSAVKENILKFF